MNILFLGPSKSPVVTFLRKQRYKVTQTERPISYRQVRFGGYDFLISYGYRHIVDEKILNLFTNKNAINLHISMLPWNRGADPNLWSWVDKTPKGVTIHLMSPKVDEGDILVQRQVHLSNGETLASSYEELHREMVDVFKAYWFALATGGIEPQKQSGEGSKHTSKDKERLAHLLEAKGWQTPVTELTN